MCPRFPLVHSGTRWWACKRCPQRRQTQPWLCFVPSEHLRWQDAKASGPQTSSCLSWRLAERECRLQAEDGPLDSGCHHPGLSGTGCVPSPRFLYHRWAAGPRLGSSAKTWICAAPAAYLYSRCDQRQLDAIIACQCALAHLVYTRSGLVSLSDIPIRRSSDVTSPFPPSGNKGYIRNRDVLLSYFFETSFWNSYFLWV